MNRVKMEDWICQEEGILNLTREVLQDLQLFKLNDLLKKQSQKISHFKISFSLSSLSQLSELPFTTAADLTACPSQFLFCSQAQISRVISQETSGTTGGAKRVFYTEGDLLRTVDFFAAGISEMLSSGEKCLITFPFSGPMGLGDLIGRAVRSLGGIPIPADFRHGFAPVLDQIQREQPETYIGFSVPLLSVYRLYGPDFPIQRALLSGDTCPKGVLSSLPMPCFPHYGSRETALGGAVTCQAHEGMHLRENHIIAEIVDDHGIPVPDGTLGELVITTIGMEAMPLLRYRTGDFTRILPDPCPCCGVTRRLDQVVRKDHGLVSIEKLDDALFSIPWVVDFKASFDGCLNLEISTSLEGLDTVLFHCVKVLYPDIPLNIHSRLARKTDFPAYVGKRRIM